MSNSTDGQSGSAEKLSRDSTDCPGTPADLRRAAHRAAGSEGTSIAAESAMAPGGRNVAPLVEVPRRPVRGRGPHLWEIPAVVDLFFILAGAAAAAALYALRDIFIPVFLAFGLAYLFNPFITTLERRWRIPRPVSVALLLVLFAAATAAFVAWLGPLLAQQAQTLTKKTPQYLQTLGGRYGMDLSSLSDQLLGWTSRLQNDPFAIFQPIFAGTGQALGLIGTVIGTTTYLVMTAMLLPIYFFVFAWRFYRLSEILPRLIPRSGRRRTLDILAKIDQAVFGFFRGRLLVALVTGVLYAAGWAWTDVPYWFLLGAGTGLLSIIPYVSVIGWPLAILLKYLDSAAGVDGPSLSWFSIVVLPSLPYLIVQFFESWWLTPWIQGQTTNLSAVTVIIVVLIGGAVAGFLGLMLAIPVASSVKILFEELLLPRWEAWAAKR
ncbi:MAG TPA: AI-2E family transporter [Nitrospira sp.]|nr:AI-2E family transporter [Nitrospira sp.]